MEAASFSGVTVRRVGIGLALAATLLASACAAGQRAQTADENETLDGTTARIGDITLAGLAILTPTSVSYPKGSNVPVRVVIANSGRQADTLTSITSPAIGDWGSFASSAAASAAASATSASLSSTVPSSAAESTSTAPGEGSTSAEPSPSDSTSVAPSTSAAPPPTPVTSISIAAGGRVSFSVPDSKRVLILTGLQQTLYPGSTIPLTFTFQRAGTVTAQVPVQLSESPQSSIIPGPSATGEAG